MNIAFCAEMLYPELPFMQRLQILAGNGVRAIEFWDYRNKDLAALTQLVERGEVAIANFSGNRSHGMLLASERRPFLDELSACMQIAGQLKCPRLMLLVQPLLADGAAPALSAQLTRPQIIDALVRCACQAGELADRAQLDLVIEPLNTSLDHPGYFLNSSALAFRCIKEISHPRVKILYDIYHMAMMGEPVLQDLKKNLDKIGYIHVADMPGRHEPGTGVIAYREIFSLLKKSGYQGTIGFEFLPGASGSAAAIQKSLEMVAHC